MPPVSGRRRSPEPGSPADAWSPASIIGGGITKVGGCTSTGGDFFAASCQRRFDNQQLGRFMPRRPTGGFVSRPGKTGRSAGPDGSGNGGIGNIGGGGAGSDPAAAIPFFGSTRSIGNGSGTLLTSGRTISAAAPFGFSFTGSVLFEWLSSFFSIGGGESSVGSTGGGVQRGRPSCAHKPVLA